MSKKDKQRAADIKSRLLNEESPFSKIQLKEKKEEPKKVIHKKVEPPKRKPGEIVKGYDPSKSFKDILDAFDRTGNPYTLPTKAKQQEIKSTKTNFGDILNKFEKGSAQKNKSNKQENVKKSQTYKPSMDFSSILDKYEGKQSPDTAKIEPVKKEVKKEEKRIVEQKKSSYIPKTDFGSLLDQFEGKTVKKKKESEIILLDENNEVNPFIKPKEDEERSKSATWSVLGGNENIERNVKEEKKVETKVEEKKPVKKTEYKPTKDFSEIFSQFEEKQTSIETVIKDKPLNQKIDEVVIEEVSFFKDEKERSETAAWYIHGGNDNVKRVVPDNLPKIERREVKKSPKPNVDFKKAFQEVVEEEVAISFDEIMKEKGDELLTIAEKTINELRRMMPESTLDLHGLTQAEAVDKIQSFIKDAVDNRLRKISIIHGKGLHAMGGIGVLRDVALIELNNSGVVREMGNAPAKNGGSGATWVILKAN